MAQISINGGFVGELAGNTWDGKWTFTKKNILIENERIVQLSKERTAKGIIGIEADNCLVLPSFVNAHTHGFEHAFKGFKDGRTIDDSHPDWFWKMYDEAPLDLLELGLRIHLAECIGAGIGIVFEVLPSGKNGSRFQSAIDGLGLTG
ncbi:MAG TPA: hypothetical protein VJ044_07065, partial [Candidatus Hodarchaeales archaeon]|nr:hypothetical protein [Candidatus Hodarchaeales archaeon]